ncbi:hypothetical protein MMC17_005528 [Xylographa soralifera]|nr:hypothetical protein [Xylographa soralifera]
MSQILSDEAVKEYEPKMIEHLNVFLKQLEPSKSPVCWSESRDLSILCMRLTLDVMCDFGFGLDPQLQLNRDLSFIPRVLQNYSWRMGIYEQYPQLAYLGVERLASWLQYDKKLENRFRSWSENFASTVLDRRDGKRKGQFSVIRDSKLSAAGTHLNDSELWAEGSFMMLAGSDTTAIAMSGIFFYLAHYPEVYETLANEIRMTFEDLSEIRSGPKLISCSYLSACITETLRICPPVPGIPWREIESCGVVVDGEPLPAGYDVGT